MNSKKLQRCILCLASLMTSTIALSYTYTYMYIIIYFLCDFIEVELDKVSSYACYFYLLKIDSSAKEFCLKVHTCRMSTCKSFCFFASSGKILVMHSKSPFKFQRTVPGIERAVTYICILIQLFACQQLSIAIQIVQGVYSTKGFVDAKVKLHYCQIFGT